jgi:hypothetical protein
MKKTALFLILLIFLLTGNSYGFDIKGLQPVAPYGIYSTFSAESLSKGKAAFSTGAEISVDPDYYRFLLQTAYGITNTIEVNMTVPYTLGDSITDGFEDISLGVKHRFFDEGKYGPSLAYILNASLSSGRDELSTDGRFGIGFIVSKKIGPLNGHANLFYEKPGNEDLEDEISLLTGFDFSASHNFKILSELYWKKSHFSEQVDIIEGTIGYLIKTSDFLYAKVGIGTDFKKKGPDFRILFSLTFLWPAEKKIKRIYEEE